MVSDIVIETVSVASIADGPDWRLRGLAEVQAEHFQEVLGNTDLVDSAEQMAISLQHQRSKRKLTLVAVDPARTGDASAVLGGCLISAPITDNTHLAFAALTVRPEHRRRGIGSTLWHRATSWAQEQHRTTILTDTVQQGEPPAGAAHALQGPTGQGRLDVRIPGAQFAQAAGLNLAQVERHSMQSLPMDPEQLAGLLSAAEEAAGPEYDLVTWQDAVPEEWMGGLITMITAMSVDAPLGEVDMREEVWDAARVRDRERVLAQMGRSTITTAARHRPSGELVGYTEILLDATDPAAVYQEITVVLGPHRGHRLGMLLKAANVVQLQRLAPQVRRVHTWNAEENEHMLAINVALGYRPTSVWGNWQLTLSGA